MRPGESFISQPIRSLQTMLRVLAEQDSRHETVIPDGIYGPSTVSAVSKFQRLHGLPVTGVTDQASWEAIVAEYEQAIIDVDEAEVLYIKLNPNQVIRKGERSPHIRLVQAMLHALADVYESIGIPSHSGILDEATADSISSFQRLNALPMTGNLDKRTWKYLVLQYPLGTSLKSTP